MGLTGQSFVNPAGSLGVHPNEPVATDNLVNARIGPL